MPDLTRWVSGADFIEMGEFLAEEGSIFHKLLFFFSQTFGRLPPFTFTPVYVSLKTSFPRTHIDLAGTWAPRAWGAHGLWDPVPHGPGGPMAPGPMGPGVGG